MITRCNPIHPTGHVQSGQTEAGIGPFSTLFKLAGTGVRNQQTLELDQFSFTSFESLFLLCKPLLATRSILWSQLLWFLCTSCIISLNLVVNCESAFSQAAQRQHQQESILLRPSKHPKMPQIGKRPPQLKHTMLVCSFCYATETRIKHIFLSFQWINQDV